MIIGTFTRDNDTGTINGTLEALGLKLELSLSANPDKTLGDKRPDFYAYGPTDNDMGAAWFHTTKENKGQGRAVTILSTTIDSPIWPAPISFALWPQREQPNRYDAIWTRSTTKKPQAEE